MNKVVVLLFALLISVNFCAAQEPTVGERVAEVSAVMADQKPVLEGFAEALETHQGELAERAIVLKYHKGNKEVDGATNDAVARIEKFNDEANEKVLEFQATWFDQIRNIGKIYTRFGELREANSGGGTEMDDFVKMHTEYMDLMEDVKTAIEFIYADCGYLRQ